MIENSENGTLSQDQAAEQLAKLMEPEGQPDAEEEIAEQETDDELESEEVEEDHADEDEGDEEVDEVEDDDDGELYYEIDGDTVSASEVKEWQKSGMRQEDYTRKTQQVAEEKRAFETQRTQELETIRTQRTQLQDALATFVVDPEPEPNWVDLAGRLPIDQLEQEKANWKARQEQKGQAAEVYRALQEQQRQEDMSRRYAEILHQYPQWNDAEVFKAETKPLTEKAVQFGYSEEDLNGSPDVRLIRLVERVVQLEGLASEVDKTKDVVKKRVVKAQKRLPAGAKPSKNQETLSKAARAKQDRFKKSPTLDNAVEALFGG